MRNIWDKYLKVPVFLFCALYTLATITNSIIYLANETFEDPSGNWHELDRAVLVLIAVIAFALIKYLKIKNFWLKVLAVYVPTMLLVFLYVYLRGLTVELASSAYRDVFINYTAGFIFVTLVVFVITLISKKKAEKLRSEVTGMNYLEQNYLNIKRIDKSSITFVDGKCIVFSECLRRRYDSDTCVAERNISATPPYFEFFTPDLPTRIVFTKTGFRAKESNQSDFISLQMKVNEMGFKTLDLS